MSTPTIQMASRETQLRMRAEEIPWSEAAQNALARTRAEPENPEAYMALGLALRAQMLLREAIAAYSDGLCRDPFHMMLYRHRGHAYVNAGEYAPGAADFEMGLRLDPKNWDCWYHLGLSYYLLGDYNRAARAYHTCYDLAQRDAFRICTADWLCMTYMKLGDLDAMREVADRIRPDMEPGGSAGYFERVLVYNGTKTPEEALADAEKQNDHMFATGAYGIAVYYACALGEKDKAKSILEKIAARNTLWSGFAEHAAVDWLARWEG